MSNAQVGQVYQQIIQDVIESSRVDFEEGGVDEGILDELKKGWQKKLSQQQLATFPWDPKPDPPPAPAAAPSTAQASPAPPSASVAVPNGTTYEHQPAPSSQGLSLPMPGGPVSADPNVKAEPHVKSEPGLDATGTPGSSEAIQQRVIHQLHAQYGSRAAGSINTLRSNMAQQPGNGAPPLPQQAPGSKTPVQQYPGQYTGQQPQPQNPGSANGQRPAPSQFDGAGDDDEEEGQVGVLMQRTPTGHDVEMGRVQIDGLLHAQIKARAKAMEGGGLMVPLNRAHKNKSAVSHHVPAPYAGPSRFDGPDDDTKDESDEDAINSDLDDSDDPVDDDDEEEDGGQIMLCMYDKVQRVKNKWKCILKDGVLSVNGKDYVFHKATGEYEW